MQVNDLEYFLEAASAPTFLEASENLHCSQSALSKAINRVEKELGVSLFYREKRKAVLTPAGITLRMSLLELKPLYERMIISVKNQSSGVTFLCSLIHTL